TNSVPLDNDRSRPPQPFALPIPNVVLREASRSRMYLARPSRRCSPQLSDRFYPNGPRASPDCGVPPRGRPTRPSPHSAAKSRRAVYDHYRPLPRRRRALPPRLSVAVPLPSLATEPSRLWNYPNETGALTVDPCVAHTPLGDVCR